MPKPREAIKYLESLDPETTIVYDIWGVEDIRHAISAMRNPPTLTNKEIVDVLELLQARHDATIGINWDIVEYAIETIVGNRGAS